MGHNSRHGVWGPVWLVSGEGTPDRLYQFSGLLRFHGVLRRSQPFHSWVHVILSGQLSPSTCLFPLCNILLLLFTPLAFLEDLSGASLLTICLYFYVILYIFYDSFDYSYLLCIISLPLFQDIIRILRSIEIRYKHSIGLVTHTFILLLTWLNVNFWEKNLRENFHKVLIQIMRKYLS